MSFPILNHPEEGIPRVKITKTREGVLTVGLVLQKCRSPRERQLMATNASGNQVPPQDEDASPVLGRRRSLRRQAGRSLPDATLWYPHKGRSQRSNLRNDASFDPPSSTGCPLHSPSGVDRDSLQDHCAETDVSSSSSKNEEGIAVPTGASSSRPEDTANSSGRAMLAAEESHGDPQKQVILPQEADAGNHGNTAIKTEDVSPALAHDCPLPFDVVDVDAFSDLAETSNNESTFETQHISAFKVEYGDPGCTVPPVCEVKEESTEEKEYCLGPRTRRNRCVAMYRNVHNRRARESTTLSPAVVCTQVQTVIRVKCEPDKQCDVCAMKVENQRDIKPFCWFCQSTDDDEVQMVDIIAVPMTQRTCKVEGHGLNMSTLKNEECGPLQSGIAGVSSHSSEEADPLGEGNSARTDVAEPLAILGIIDSSSFSGHGSENMIGGPLCISKNEGGDFSIQVIPAESLDTKLVASDERDPPKDKLLELMESSDIIPIEPMDMTDGLASLIKKNSDDSKSSEEQINTSFATSIDDSRVRNAQSAAELQLGGVACSAVSVQQRISRDKCSHTNVLVQVNQPTSGSLNDAVYIPEEPCLPYKYERFIPWRNEGPRSSSCHPMSNHSRHHDHHHHVDHDHYVHEVHHHHHYHHHHHHHHHHDHHHHGPSMNSTNTHNLSCTPGAPTYVTVSTQRKNTIKTSTCNHSQAPSPAFQALPKSETFDCTSSALPNQELLSHERGKVAYPYLDYIADRTVCQGFHPVEVKLIAEDLARNGRLSVQLFNSHQHLVRKLTGLTSFMHLESLREYLPQIEPVYCSTAQEEFLLSMIKLCTNCSNRDLARWSGLSEEDAEAMFLEVVTRLARGIRDSPRYLWPTTAHLEANMAWRAGAETPASFTRLPMGCEDELDLKKNYCGLEHVFRVLKQDLAEYESDVLGLCHSLYIINQMLPYQGFYPVADESVCQNCTEGPYARKESCLTLFSSL